MLEYDGSAHCGWQRQPSGCSVQDALEAALSAIACHEVRVVAAGRTDAGVHALYQAAHFDTTARRPPEAWVRGVNALLPGCIAVRWASPVADDFHARYCAKGRRYLYLLSNHAVRPGLLHGRAGWFHRPLDVDRMRSAAQVLLGEHDFSAFRAAECQAASPVRTLTRLEIIREGDLIVFDLCANAFLQHMVRNIVGCLVYVGKGSYSRERVQALLAGRDRRLAAPTFAAAGLYLAGVDYDASWNLPSPACLPPADAWTALAGRRG